MAFEALHIHRYRFVRLLLTTALAAWVGCADMLATEWAAADSSQNQLTKVQSQFRMTSGILPAQFCRFVPSRSSARTVEVTDEEDDRSSEGSTKVTNAERPAPRKFTRETLSFRIETPDRLIELPGTPPPARLC